MTKRKALSIFAIALLATLVAAGALQAQTSGRAVFGWMIADRATVQSGGLTVTGATVLGDVTTTGANTLTDTTLADTLAYDPQTDLTLTMNGYITPTGVFQPVRSAGAVSISGANIADGSHGDVLILFNAGAQTITITETTGLVSAGNIALGALDAATLVFSGTTWIQVGASNN